MQQENSYPQSPASVNRPPAAPFTGSILVNGSPVFLESDNMTSIAALVGLAMRAKQAERRLLTAAVKEHVQ